jgi:non-specific serine/threonine protein kinase
MNADEKTCPFCGETVEAVATGCPCCHAEPTNTQINRDSPPAADALQAERVLDLLSRLVDKSLVVYEEDAQGVGRFRFMETMRQYTRERMLESGESHTTRGRHQDYFQRLAEKTAPKLEDAKSAVWFQRLETEHDNLRTALEWCLSPKADEQSDAAAATGLRFCNALYPFWSSGFYLREARQYLADALARAASRGPTKERAAALRWCGYFAAQQGDYDEAQAHLQEMLALSKEMGYTEGVGYALGFLGHVAGRRRDFAHARALLEECRILLQQSGQRHGLAEALHELAILAEHEGDYSQARSLYEQSLVLFRELGYHHGVAAALHGLGFVALCEQDFARARALLKESLALFCDSEVRSGKVRSLERFAHLALAEGQAVRAVRLLGAADAARKAIGFPQPPSEREEHDRVLAAARSALEEGASGVAWAWAAGQAMTLEQAVTYALEAEPGP